MCMILQEIIIIFEKQREVKKGKEKGGRGSEGVGRSPSLAAAPRAVFLRGFPCTSLFSEMSQALPGSSPPHPDCLQ